MIVDRARSFLALPVDLYYDHRRDSTTPISQLCLTLSNRNSMSLLTKLKRGRVGRFWTLSFGRVVVARHIRAYFTVYASVLKFDPCLSHSLSLHITL